MNQEALAEIVQEGGRLLTGLLQLYAKRPHRPVVRGGNPEIVVSSEVKNEPLRDTSRVSTKETIEHQKREIVKEFLLLEGHLQQSCKIGGKACGCCTKHPITIEGLAQETSAMTPDPIFREIAQWAKSISPITTEEASASGEYDDEYPNLAIKAREFRRVIMPSLKEEDEASPPTEA